MSTNGKITSSHRVSRGMPKADMHVHIGLALNDKSFLRAVREGRTDLGPEFLMQREKRYFPTLTDHHAAYEAIAKGMNIGPEDLASTTQKYLENIAAQGAIYAEISNSFRDEEKFEGQMAGVEAGIFAAQQNTNIEARIVVTTLRNHGYEQAERAAKFLAKNPRDLVTGFGLVGDESKGDFVEFKRALSIAWHEAGLGIVPHVAEQHPGNALGFLQSIPDGAMDVSETDPRRVRAGHATTIHLSSDLVKAFSDTGVCVESCLSSNKRIGLPQATRSLKPGYFIRANGRSASVDQALNEYFDQMAEHPIDRFVEAGIPVCLGSDNPLIQNTNISKEYSQARVAGLRDPFALLELTYNAIRFANVDFETRMRLLGKLDEYKMQMHAGTVSTEHVNAVSVLNERSAGHS